MKKVLVLITLMVFLMAGAAQADWARLDFSGGTSVRIHDPGGDGDTSAGLYTAYFGPDQATAKAYEAFCVDWANIGSGWYDTFKMIALPDVLTYKQAAYIFDKYGSVANGPEAQVAIWEVIFEQLTAGGALGNYTASTNFYVITNPSPVNLSTVADYVTDATTADLSNFDTSKYKLLVSPLQGDYYGVSVQDIIVRDPVPEPGSLMLLGAGLLGLGGLARRKRG